MAAMTAADVEYYKGKRLRACERFAEDRAKRQRKGAVRRLVGDRFPGPDEMVMFIRSGPDYFGRQSYASVWIDPGQVDTYGTEIRVQHSHGYVEENVRRLRLDGWAVAVLDRTDGAIETTVVASGVGEV